MAGQGANTRVLALSLVCTRYETAISCHGAAEWLGINSSPEIRRGPLCVLDAL